VIPLKANVLFELSTQISFAQHETDDITWPTGEIEFDEIGAALLSVNLYV
jgi:hypothetical protein